MAEELLVIQEPKEGDFLKEIKWNKDDIVKYVRAVAEQYEGLTYTDEEIRSAKEDRAHLNALKKSISDRRIQVKKAFMEPYEKFEAEVKDVVAMIDSPVKMIDSQIKEYEEKVKKEKEDKLKECYEEEIGELSRAVSFDKIFDPAWLNASTSMKRAKEQIRSKISRIRDDIQNISTFFGGSGYESIALNRYLMTFDFSASVAEAKSVEEMDKRRRAEEERLRKEQEEDRQKQIKAEEDSGKIVSFRQPANIEEAEVQQAPEVEKEKATIPAQDPDEKPEPAASDKEKLCKASFTIYGTKEQIFAVRDFMKENHIRFGKVE